MSVLGKDLNWVGSPSITIDTCQFSIAQLDLDVILEERGIDAGLMER